MMVMMMATTPSVKASSRPFPISGSCQVLARHAATAPRAAAMLRAMEISTL